MHLIRSSLRGGAASGRRQYVLVFEAFKSWVAEITPRIRILREKFKFLALVGLVITDLSTIGLIIYDFEPLPVVRE